MNIGISTSMIQSICWKVRQNDVAAIPRAAIPRAISRHAGMVSSTHHDPTRPSSAVTATKLVA